MSLRKAPGGFFLKPYGWIILEKQPESSRRAVGEKLYGDEQRLFKKW